METWSLADCGDTVLASEVRRLSRTKGEVAAVKATVVGLHGDLAGKRFPVGGTPITFGRDEDNDIIIADPSVSRLHAVLRQEADGYVIADREALVSQVPL